MLTVTQPYHLNGGGLTLQVSIITVLGISILFLLVLLFIGIRNSFRLKAENERLSKPSVSSEEDNQVYRDFTEGHLYDSY